MSVEIAGSVAVLICALVPAVAFVRNLFLYRPPPSDPGEVEGPVSVLIPARDEESSIGAALRSVLDSVGVELEVVVLDDASTDRTADIVRELAAADPRVRLAQAPSLPAGWCGKQHACAVLARLARHSTLVFVDADVRLEPLGLARSLAALRASGAALASGFPRQVTGSWLERLLIPLIHFVLLGFLPLGRMRRSTAPAYAAGCGQLMVVDRAAYERAGGHGALRASRHDGIRLPRALRAAGYRTDLFDATTVASCRMYRRAVELWRGLGKNATEGLGAPTTIVPATLLLMLGQVLPGPLLLVALIASASSSVLSLLTLAFVLTLVPRQLAASRFRQPRLAALAHPLAVLLLLLIQWQALVRELLGRPSEWKGRSYVAAATGADEP